MAEARLTAITTRPSACRTSNFCQTTGASSRGVSVWGQGLRLSNFFLSVACAGSVIVAAVGSAGADYRIRKDYGGFLDQYKLKYAAIRDRGDRVVIDGVCNSACTLVLGIVPLNRICVTRLSLDRDQAPPGSAASAYHLLRHIRTSMLLVKTKPDRLSRRRALQ
jgi:hypothetical protein